MTATSYPGVYVEEVPGGARPIEAAGTSTAAFVGVAQKGPTTRAVRITSWQEFQTQYGEFISEGYLGESVFQFFNNGGRQCYIVRVAGVQARAASVEVNNRAPTPVAAVRFSANSVGSWGNALYAKVDDNQQDPGNRFDLAIYVQTDPMARATLESALRETPVELLESLSMDPTSNDYFVSRIAKESRYLTAENLAANSVLIRGFYLGGENPGLPQSAESQFEINIDGDGFQKVTLTALNAASLEVVRKDIQDKVSALVRQKNTTAAAAFTGFTCEIVSGAIPRLRLVSGTESAKSSVVVRASGQANAADRLKLGPGFGKAVGGLSLQRPALGILEVGDAPSRALLGLDDNNLDIPLGYQAGFSLLDRITDVSLLAVPGVPGMFDAGVAYCENRPLRDIFFIGETALTDTSPSDAETTRKKVTKPNTYGAMYFPWIKAPDPSGKQQSILLPPSGFMAGLCARIDTTRGVWKAPAGTEASISGASGLLAELNDIEQGNLNKIGVNCLRRFDLAGIVSWGARTVYSDPEYKYVPVRRTAIMLRRSIYDGIQWAVFEPNDHRLWAALRLNIGSFMNGLFRAGAFQGETSNEAYFVRCGLGDTMVQGDIDRGQVIVDVGFAALKPAEFVIVRIQQKAGQN